jgi:hypothetical protein
VNAAVLGDEILYFRDATLESDGTYTLRGLLRGRRGSEYAMARTWPATASCWWT